MNCTEIFNYIFESFNSQNIDYVIIHSYQYLPDKFDSDIDTAINVSNIKDAIKLLDDTLAGTGWRVIQFWRHENYAADCVISNDEEFLQVDFCTHYERNGRVVIPVQELLDGKRMHKNFYVPKPQTEFTYVLVKKILKKVFSDGSKQQLTALWKAMSKEERQDTKAGLKRFIAEVNEILECVESSQYDLIDLERAHQVLKKKTSNIADNLHYKVFDLKRRFERIVHPTGLFIVLLGVDGAGKTTIAESLKERYTNAFRRIDHYHSRVRVLKDISQLKKDAVPIDASDPHGKKQKSGKLTSVVKFGYYFLDFLIGNIKITVAKIKSTLVLVERYYYDYSIDKVRYNLNLSDGFLLFFERFILKPDIIFILTGDSQKLLDRKHEITIDEIDEQKKKLKDRFDNNSKAVFIDTTEGTVDECVAKMLKECNTIMRKRRKW
ncbi:MAG: hypothetical protein Q4F03_04120 [Eubacteriales bacterium]|nr:hypothetical protein [Eubacteriales bacterium]